MGRKKSLDDFEQLHGGSKIEQLQRDVEVERAKVDALSGVQNKVNIVKCNKDILKFAIIGDLHFGSLYAHDGALSSFFDYCVDVGVDRCYVAGDILEGHRIYRGQEFELRDVGLEAQLARFGSMQLNDKVNVEFITGNHDASFKNQCGVNVGRAISGVSGWKFLGEDQARVEYKTPNGRFELMLMHPGGGSAYALSYRPQKIAEQLEGGVKPHLLAIGHYHKAEVVPSYRNICLVQSGTFQKQTPFMARGGLAAHVGGWVFDVFVGDGFNCIKQEFIAFYK